MWIDIAGVYSEGVIQDYYIMICQDVPNQMDMKIGDIYKIHIVSDFYLEVIDIRYFAYEAVDQVVFKFVGCDKRYSERLLGWSAAHCALLLENGSDFIKVSNIEEIEKIKINIANTIRIVKENS